MTTDETRDPHDRRTGGAQGSRDQSATAETLTQLEQDQERVAAGLALTESIPPGEFSIPGYQITNKLGEGGMGAVYLARDLSLKREVALKTLRATSARPEVVARFWAEAEVMAEVKHPHVVQVYELGKDVSRPYIVMEYVSGGSLADRLARATQYPPRDAALLLEKVARGVAAAHELSIVHRDLKPANVLLTTDAEPKVADFGVAKRVSHNLTMTQELMGTPAYMAPEQAEARAKFVGPTADVWALGVILYECVSGAKPFEGETLEALLSRINSSEPTSLRVRVRDLPRDLDTVVTKCLSQEPGHRYPTAAELADDLARFLRGEPIAARPLGRIERTRLWCRRHPVAVVLILMSLAFVVGQSIATAVTLQALAAEKKAKETAEERELAAEHARKVAEEHSRVAATARDAAQASATESADLVTLLVRLFETSTPLGFQPLNQESRALRLDETTARVLLMGLIEDVRSRLLTRSLARAEILDSLGSACRSRGHFGEARALLEEALSIRRELLGEDNKEVAASLHNLGWLAQDEGQFPEAEELYRRALGMRRKWLGDPHSLVTATMFNLAWVTAHQFDAASPERLKKAETLLRDILARQRQWPSGEHGDPVLTTVSLALVIYGNDNAERKDEAYRHLLVVIGLIPKHPRSKPLLEAAEKYMRSQKLQEKQQFAEAIQLRREVLVTLREQFGNENFVVAALLADLASVLAKSGRLDEAGIEFKEGKRIARKNFPGGHWLIAKTLAEAGEFYASAGRHDTAEAEFREAMEVAKAVSHTALWQRARDGRVNSLKALGRDSDADDLRRLQPPTKT